MNMSMISESPFGDIDIIVNKKDLKKANNTLTKMVILIRN